MLTRPPESIKKNVVATKHTTEQADPDLPRLKSVRKVSLGELADIGRNAGSPASGRR
jgi:hypothetical protein